MLRFHAGFEIKLPLVANSLLKEIETITWMRDEDPALEFERFYHFLEKYIFCYFENMSSTIFFLQRLVSTILPQDILSNDWDM